MFKILFGHLVDRRLEIKAFKNAKPPRQESAPLARVFGLPVKNGPLPAELKFKENTKFQRHVFA